MGHTGVGLVSGFAFAINYINYSSAFFMNNLTMKSRFKTP